MTLVPDLVLTDLRDAPHHLAQLAAWHHRQWSYLNPGMTLKERIQEMQAYLSPGPIPSLYLVELNGELVGSASLSRRDMDSHQELCPWLASVYVAEPFRRRGVGAKLVQYVTAKAKALGQQRVYLFTPDQAPFYRHLGWQVVVEENYRDHPVTVMVYDHRSGASTNS